MMNFIEKLFKKEPLVNYTIADYTPAKAERSKIKLQPPLLDKNIKITHDEMKVDHLYQKK